LNPSNLPKEVALIASIMMFAWIGQLMKVLTIGKHIGCVDTSKKTKKPNKKEGLGTSRAFFIIKRNGGKPVPLWLILYIFLRVFNQIINQLFSFFIILFFQCRS